MATRDPDPGQGRAPTPADSALRPDAPGTPAPKSAPASAPASAPDSADPAPGTHGAVADAPHDAALPGRPLPPPPVAAGRAVFALGLAGLALLIGPGAWVAAGEAQRLAGERAAAALAASGAGWARVSADGLVLHVAGTYPDESSHLAALTAVSRVAPVARVVDAAQVALAASDAAPGPMVGGAPVLLVAGGDGPAPAGPAPASPAPVPAPPADPNVPLTLVRDGDAITIAGAVHPDLVAAIREAVAEIPDAPEVGDASLPARRPPTPEELALARAAAHAVARLASARVEIAPGLLSLGGAPRSIAGGATPDESPDAIEAALRASAPPDATLLIDITRPPPVFRPFRFVVAQGPSGPTVLGCDLRTPAERAAVRAAIAALPAETPLSDAVCRIGVGAPSDRWGEAALAGLATLGEIGAGRFEMIDSVARLVAAPQTSPYRFGVAARALAERLPTGFVLHLVAPPPAAFRPGAETAGDDDAPPRWFGVRLAPGTAKLEGAAPDEASRAAVAAFARARLGAVAIEDAMQLTDAAPPPAWRRAAFAGIDALRRLEEGMLAFDGETAVIRGRSERPLAAREVAVAARRLAALDVPTRVEVTVDLPALAARLPLPPAECLAELARAVEADPIQFDPGAARVAEGSRGVLDRLASILKRCEGLVVEIGGHTDSQGREETNLNLSRARAGAVLDALFARGVSTARMIARGYGEGEPIADNATEAGRALNRRIVFSDAALSGDEGEEGEGG